MRSTFALTLRTLTRTPAALIWILAFPLIMSTVFLFMFSGLRSDGAMDAVPVAVVADDAWEASPFSQVVDALAEKDARAEKDAGSDAAAGADALLAVTEVADAAEAEALLAAGDVDGIWRAADDGTPALTVASVTKGQSLCHTTFSPMFRSRNASASGSPHAPPSA